ncbi:hypothetical protein [Jongsikchunia kroppenstedtii]|uniref:hypothetical protein n=1 Tax=Jongsikchunia kroppenstedtii TaxID=1121721 RepID=UPI00138B117B|nr:hypothetical protein [Jongsikchunia kroppenstedtii]
MAEDNPTRPPATSCAGVALARSVIESPAGAGQSSFAVVDPESHAVTIAIMTAIVAVIEPALHRMFAIFRTISADVTIID